MAAPKKVTFLIGARDTTRRVFRRVGRQLRELGRDALRVGAQIAGVATAGFALLSRSALKTSKNLKDTADQLGLTTDFIQEFSNSVKEGGASAESSATFLQRFVTNLGKARQGQASFRKAFLDAGIVGKDLFQDPLVVLDQLLARVKDLDQAGRQAIVSPIGDVEGVKAINALLGQQLDTVQKISTFGRGLGIIPKETIDRLDAIGTKFRTAFEKIKPQLFNQIADVLEKIVPLLPGLINTLLGFARAVERLIRRTFGQLETLREALGGDTVSPGGVNPRVAARQAAIRRSNALVGERDRTDEVLRELVKIKNNTGAGAVFGE